MLLTVVAAIVIVVVIVDYVRYQKARSVDGGVINQQ